MSCFKRCRGLCSAVGMLLTTVVDKGVLLLRVQMRCVNITYSYQCWAITSPDSGTDDDI